MSFLGIRHGIFRNPDGKKIAKYLESQPLHHSQVFEKLTPEGNHIFSFFLLPTYELKMQLLGFGKDVKILEPKDLQNEIIENTKEIIKQYQ